MKSPKTLLSALASTLLVLTAGATQFAVAESVPFTGKANLCAVDLSGAVTETKGKGQTIERNLVYLYRFDTSHEAMTGWDVMTFDAKFVRNGSQYSTGEHFLVPDVYAAGAVREEMENLLVQESMLGTMVGMGSLDGVTVEYTTTLNLPEAEYCYDHPYCDDPGATCVYLSDIPGQIPIGYDFEGTVNTSE